MTIEGPEAWVLSHAGYYGTSYAVPCLSSITVSALPLCLTHHHLLNENRDPSRTSQTRPNPTQPGKAGPQQSITLSAGALCLLRARRERERGGLPVHSREMRGGGASRPSASRNRVEENEKRISAIRGTSQASATPVFSRLLLPQAPQRSLSIRAHPRLR